MSTQPWAKKYISLRSREIKNHSFNGPWPQTALLKTSTKPQLKTQYLTVTVFKIVFHSSCADIKFGNQMERDYYFSSHLHFYSCKVKPCYLSLAHKQPSVADPDRQTFMLCQVWAEQARDSSLLKSLLEYSSVFICSANATVPASSIWHDSTRK